MTTCFSSKTLSCLGSLLDPLAVCLLSLLPLSQQHWNATVISYSLSSRAPGPVPSFPLDSSPSVSTTLSSWFLWLPSKTAAPNPETWGPLGLLSLPHPHIQLIPSATAMMVVMMIVDICKLPTCQATHQTLYLLPHIIIPHPYY